MHPAEAWALHSDAACALPSGAYRYGGGSNFTRRGWIVAFLLAMATFGVGLVFRRRRIPRWLLGLGTISYSVYLVHPVLLAVTDGTIGRWERDNLALEIAFYAVLLPVSVLTYRAIEVPGQTWGRRLARRIPAPRRASGLKGAELPPATPDASDR
ncbi:acyltransferase family protein [Streptomyces yerevanensis]|uniref:acyltransferase family protein n=1 Tax=Streptomyces yerevanensis TaxID=66378 RepID=UPI003CCBF9C6